MQEVIIIGAGMAGLSAARELKKLGLGYLILEASDHIGGRATSIVTGSGTAVDLGAHWLHGEDNPIKEMLDHYKIAYEKDRSSRMHIYKDGQIREGDKDWLEQCVDQEKAGLIKAGKHPDVKLSEVAKDEDSRQILKDLALMWNGLEPPVEPSALEFLNDRSTPGGLIVENGLGIILGHMLEDVGMQHVRLNAPVTRIVDPRAGVEVHTKTGVHHARRAIFTASLTVLKSGTVAFDPPLSEAFQKSLEDFAMGKMNKIIVELRPEFFAERKVGPHQAFQLLDAAPPQFCFASSPLITLFISGDMAEIVERYSPEEALAHLKKALILVEELQGFEEHMVGDIIITRWVSNPFTLGAYSASLPGGKRTWPHVEGNLIFAGDTFDPLYFSSLAGAYRSGLAAARMVAEKEKAVIVA